MPEANSAPILSNPPSRLPTLAPDPAHKPKLMGRLRESLRSRHYSPRPKFRHGLFHLTHDDFFKPETSSPLAGEGLPCGARFNTPQGKGEGDQKEKPPSAIPLPHICWKRVTIFEPSRNFWATMTSRRR